VGRLVAVNCPKALLQLGRLQTTRDAVLQVASEVGYDSEAAFNRAFKREFGVPPGQFRRSVSQWHQGLAGGDYPVPPPSDAA